MEVTPEETILISQKRKRVLDDQVCRVCGDQSTGKHYGVYSCDGCSGFFKRTTRRPEPWICKNLGSCGVDKNSRNECKACRLNKCIESGMSTEGLNRRSRVLSISPGDSSTIAHAPIEPDDSLKTMEIHVVDIPKGINELTTAVHRPLTALNSPLNSNTVIIKSELDMTPLTHTTPAHAPQGNIAARTIIQKPITPLQHRGPVVNKSNNNTPMFGLVTSRDAADNVSISVVSSTPQAKNRLVTSTHAHSSSPTTVNGSSGAPLKLEARRCSLQELVKAVEPVYFHSTENIHDAAMRLMTSSIRFARNLACFTKIPFRDQIILLEESWKKLFLLDAAYWALPLEVASLLNVATGSDDIAGRRNATEIRTVQELLTHLRSFRCDMTELACLKAIIIFKPETKGLKDAQTVDKIQDEIQLLLSSHVISLHPNYPARFGKLLLSLLPVQIVAEKPIEEVLFKVTNDKDIFETLLSKLIDS